MAFAGGFTRGGNEDVGGGVLLAVGIAVVFFAGWSWWTLAGLLLTVAGVAWLAVPNRHE